MSKIRSVYYEDASINELSDRLSSRIGKATGLDPSRRTRSMMPRLLIVDDQELLREGIHALLRRREDIEVVAQASDGAQAVESARLFRPDIVLMDIDMPRMNGVEATRRIVAEFPDARVIALTMLADAAAIGDMLAAGAAGYVVKRCAFEEVLRAIHEVASGRMYLCPLAAEALAQRDAQPSPPRKRLGDVPLSPRERQTLLMIAEGYSTKEIAAQLKLSIKTVETHRKRVMNKLHLRTVAGLTKYAIAEGMISIDGARA